MVDGRAPENGIWVGTFGAARSKNFLVDANIQLIVDVRQGGEEDLNIAEREAQQFVSQRLGAQVRVVCTAWNDIPSIRDAVCAIDDALNTGNSVMIHSGGNMKAPAAHLAMSFIMARDELRDFRGLIRGAFRDLINPDPEGGSRIDWLEANAEGSVHRWLD